MYLESLQCWDHYLFGTIILHSVCFWLIYLLSYADDNMPHIVTDYIDDRIKSLEEASVAFLQWFANNLFKNNSEKC